MDEFKAAGFDKETCERLREIMNETGIPPSSLIGAIRGFARTVRIMGSLHCVKCEYCKVVHADGFSFYGCFHKPYRGKWVVEIWGCPKFEEKDGADNG